MIEPAPSHAFKPLLAPLAVIVVALLLHFSVGPMLGSYIERIVLDCLIAVTLAVSLNIVNGYTGQFSIGHAAFYAIGGYTAGLITFYTSLIWWNDSPSPAGQQAVFILATLLGGMIAAIAGWLVGLPSLRLRGDYLAIVTLGFGEIVRVLLQQTNSQIFSREALREATSDQLWPPPVGGSLGFTNIPKTTTVLFAAIVAGFTLIAAWRLKKSTFGRSMIAIRDNEIAAEAMGVNVTRLKVWAFVIAAFFAGVAGSLYAHEPGTQLMPVDGGFARSFDIVIIVVLGGLGSISGAAVAAVLLTVANEWLREPTQIWHIALIALALRLMFWPRNRLKAAIWWITIIALAELARFAADRYGVKLGDYRMILYALALILVMILRPTGLFGTHEVTDVMDLRKNEESH